MPSPAPTSPPHTAGSSTAALRRPCHCAHLATTAVATTVSSSRRAPAPPRASTASTTHAKHDLTGAPYKPRTSPPLRRCHDVLMVATLRSIVTPAPRTPPPCLPLLRTVEPPPCSPRDASMVNATMTPSVLSHVCQAVEHQSSPEPLDLGALLHIEPKIELLCCLKLTSPS
jgi:hypothetical protein